MSDSFEPFKQRIFYLEKKVDEWKRKYEVAREVAIYIEESLKGDVVQEGYSTFTSALHRVDQEIARRLREK